MATHHRVAAKELCLLLVVLSLSCSDSGSASMEADASEPSGQGDAGPINACFSESEHTGEATYYAADGSGNCSFEVSADLMVAALNTSDYDGSASCGGCIEVTGPDGAVIVQVVDRCPGCQLGDVDLSQEAFEKIAPLAAGRVAIQWDQVACPGDASIELHFKDGSNAFWTALQFRQHRYRITGLEASSGTREWHDVERLNYNYFVDSEGLGEGPYDFRVHSVNGDLLEIVDVEPGNDLLVSTGQQFPLCQ